MPSSRPATDPKIVNNRVHFDLTTSADNRDAQTDRLLRLAHATPGIGQAGTEGNRSCMVRPSSPNRTAGDICCCPRGWA